MLSGKAFHRLLHRSRYENVSLVMLSGVSSPAASVASVGESVANVNATNTTPNTQSPQLHALEQQFRQKFKKLFPPELPAGLPPHRDEPFDIQLTGDARPHFQQPYRLSPPEEDELRRQLTILINKGFVLPLHHFSQWAAPVLFVRKSDNSLRFCVDFRQLNKYTLKDAAALPDIRSLIDRLALSRVFSSLDLASGFHQIPLTTNAQKLCVFSTQFGLYSFRVLPFGLKNGSSRFHALLTRVLQPFLHKCVILYIDDILIYSPDIEAHKRDLTAVFNALLQQRLFCAPHKTHLFRTQVKFCGWQIEPGTVKIAQDKAVAVTSWPLPASVTALRQFLGFSNFLRDHIPRYATICKPLTDALRTPPGAIRPLLGSSPVAATPAFVAAFRAVQQAIATAPCLCIPRPDLPFIVTTDASSVALGAVIFQQHPDGRHPVAFLSRSLSHTSARHQSARDLELDAVLMAIKEFSHWLRGVHFTVECDHASLQFLNSSKQLTGKLARAATFLMQYDFAVKIIKGSRNIADGLSRSDHGPPAASPFDDTDHEWYGVSSRPATAVTAATPTSHTKTPKPPPQVNCEPALLRDIVAAYPRDTQVHAWMAALRANPDGLSNLVLTQDGVLLRKDSDPYVARVVVPAVDDLRVRIMDMLHTSNLGAHPGCAITLEKVAKRFYWPHMSRDVQEFVDSCIACATSKHATQSPKGLLQPMPIPTTCFETVSVDFLGPLPETTKKNTQLMSVVDHFSKRVVLVPLPNISAQVVADALFDYLIVDFGAPKCIVTDRGRQFISEVFAQFSKRVGFKWHPSTSRHPQTNGAVERVHKVIGERVRALTDNAQTNWDELVKAVQFSLNSSLHSGLGTTPFHVHLGYEPAIPGLDETPRLFSSPSDRLSYLAETRAEARRNLIKAKLQQTMHADRHRRDVEFATGDLVYLSAAGITEPQETAGPSHKLRHLRLGPFKILKQLSAVTYQLELPSHLRIHDVFHVSVLSRVIPSPPKFDARLQSPPSAPLPDHPDLYEVEAIIKARWKGSGKYKHREFYVKFKGYPTSSNMWVAEHNLDSASTILHQARLLEPPDSEPRRRGRPRKKPISSM